MQCQFFRLPDLFIQRMKIAGGVIPNLDEVLDPNTTNRRTTAGHRGFPVWRQKVWKVLDSPESSVAARRCAIFGNVAILLSTLVASLKTINQLDFIPWSVVELLLNCW